MERNIAIDIFWNNYTNYCSYNWNVYVILDYEYSRFRLETPIYERSLEEGELVPIAHMSLARVIQPYQRTNGFAKYFMAF